jgi:hypothetical protein
MTRVTRRGPRASHAAVLLASAALGCAPQPAPAPAPTASAPPVAAAGASADAGNVSTRPWTELYPDAPKTELDTTGKDDATAAKLRKLSVDIEVTYRELAKIAQSAPACSITESSCVDDWTRYVAEVAAVKQRIDRPTASCDSADSSPERALVLEHHDYQSRAYQSHVDALVGQAKSAEGKAELQRLLKAAEGARATPPCVEPGRD